MTHPGAEPPLGRALVAGVGNIFLGDDGFGSAVCQRLAAQRLPPSVRVADFGIAGIHLAYELLEEYELLVVVDAVGRGEPPGTVSLIEPDVAATNGTIPDPHAMDVRAVLDHVSALRGSSLRVLLVGCEPAQVDEGIGLSEPVAGAVDVAARLVREALTREGFLEAPNPAMAVGPG
jgi:hydrogenase maturation protease